MLKAVGLGAGLACTVALPAAAADPICGGISLVGSWVGDSAATSDISTAPAPFMAEGSVPIAGHLVRMFTLSQPAAIRIDVAAPGGADPYITLVDMAGTEVAADDDSGGDLDSRIVTDLDPGTYCLAVRSYETGVTPVTTEIGRADQAFTARDTPTARPDTGGAPEGAACFLEATPTLGTDLGPADLSAGRAAIGTVAAAPAYGFTLSEPLSLTVTAAGGDGGDPLIRLLDRDGRVLGENDDADGLDSRIDMTDALPPGAYCVEVEDLNGDSHPIEIALALFDPRAERKALIDAAETAPLGPDDAAPRDIGALSTTTVADITAGPAATWVRFGLPAGGLVVIEAVGNGLDPEIVLFDQAGREVAANDDGQDTLDSFLARRLHAGDYLLATRIVGDTEAGPVVLSLQRFVPAR